MPLTTITTAPSLSSFIPLSDHQSTTPQSFYAATPVLYHHAPSARALFRREQASELPFSASATTSSSGAADDENVVVEVDVYVSSE